MNNSDFTIQDGLRLVFSASNINRSKVLTVKVKRVEKFKFVNKKVAVVTYVTTEGHRCARFFSYKNLAGVAMDMRKDNGKSLLQSQLVFSNPAFTNFTVASQSNLDDEYYVIINDNDEHDCNCLDYQKGSKLTKKWHCKHIYAALGYCFEFNQTLKIA